MKKSDLEKINRLLTLAEEQISMARALLISQEIILKAGKAELHKDEKTVEGIFDGQSMVDADGNIYPVAANYASKSKLVTGDLLKLSIDENGNFIFKQIGPIARRKLVAKLLEKNDQFQAETEDGRFKLLLASVTYFKAKAGDKITVVVPADQASEYAALENVIQSL